MQTHGKKAPREVDIVEKLRRAPRTRAIDSQLLQKLNKLEAVLGVRHGGMKFINAPVIDFKSIPLCGQLVIESKFSSLIKKRGPIQSRELDSAIASLNLGVHFYESGAIPAATNPA